MAAKKVQKAKLKRERTWLEKLILIGTIFVVLYEVYEKVTGKKVKNKNARKVKEVLEKLK